MITKYAWSTGPPPEGETTDVMLFKNYTHTNTLGKKNAHTKWDLTQPSYSFFTVDNGSIIVKCELTFAAAATGTKYAGGLPLFTAKSRAITSVRPTAKWADVVDGVVTLYPDMFKFGAIPNSPIQIGQEWKDVAISVPPPFAPGGQGCFVQLITANRDLWRNTTPGHYSHFVYLTTDALDTAFPYPFSTGAWNIPGTGRFVDSPAQSLD